MIVEELQRMFGKSRRTIMRMVQLGKLPQPIEHNPMSWDETEVKAARSALRREKRYGRKRSKQVRDRDERKRRRGQGSGQNEAGPD